MAISFYLAQPLRSSRVIYIPQGSIAKTVLHLERSGFQVTFLDGWLLRLIGKPQSGWIDIKASVLRRGDLLYRLTVSKAPLEEVTLIPGETLYFFIENLKEQFGLDGKRLQEAYERYAPYPDGVIVPETYRIPKGMSERHLMYYLVNESLSTHKKLSEKLLGRYDEVQWFKYITIASVIQKEAANIEEMPLISAVIYNRLKKKMRLQMDGTLNYERYSHTKVTPYRIQNNSSPFNTYKIPGLPPSPVGSASLDAVKAAIFPAKVDYLYFVKGKNGTHTFSKSYKSHLRNIQNGKK